MRVRLITILAAGTMLLAAPAHATRLEPPAVPYGPDPSETLQEYPAPSPGVPTLLVIPEGGFDMSLTKQDAPKAENLRDNHGYAVALVKYPVDGPHTPAFPLEPDAILNAIEWTRQHAAEFGGDPERIVLVGGSAGGALALIAAERTRVYAVASLSGPANFMTRAMEHAAMRKALGCTRTACDPEYAAEWQPISNITFCTPTILFGASAHDLVPLEQQEEMAAAMSAAGCQPTLQVMPQGHAFAYAGRAFPKLAAFLAGLER